jgi:hypothetical protein
MLQSERGNRTDAVTRLTVTVSAKVTVMVMVTDYLCYREFCSQWVCKAICLICRK